MTRTSEHGTETANSGISTAACRTSEEEKIGNFLASCGIFNPLSIALATGTVRYVSPRRRPGRPRKMTERDEQIARMRDEQNSFGQIAKKLGIRREVCMSAYYRMVKRRAGSGYPEYSLSVRDKEIGSELTGLLEKSAR